MIRTNTIYKLDSAGGVRTWAADISGNQWRIITGGPGRKPVTTGWTTCKGKQGRSDDEQAQFEANASLNQKLAREYRLTEAELSSVPPSPMLAHKYEGGVTFPVFSQPKLDGIRALISRHGAFSREYQPHLNVEHILQALEPVFAANPGIMFDGELYNHDFKDNFGKISSIVRKQSPTPAQRAEAELVIQYHIYDLPSCPGDFGERFAELRTQLFKLGEHPSIVLVPTQIVDDKKELDAVYGSYLEAGYEGQMVRLDAPYDFDKRSKSLLKRKEFITEEFDLLRIEEGNGNWAGFAKRCVFEIPWTTPGYLAGGAECGAGIRGTQAQMKELLTQTITEGSTVTVRHFANTPDGMPRFPVAIDFHFGGRKD